MKRKTNIEDYNSIDEILSDQKNFCLLLKRKDRKEYCSDENLRILPGVMELQSNKNCHYLIGFCDLKGYRIPFYTSEETFGILPLVRIKELSITREQANFHFYLDSTQEVIDSLAKEDIFLKNKDEKYKYDKEYPIIMDIGPMNK